MNTQETRLKALGAALRAKFEASDDMPTELQVLVLRLLLRDAEKLPVPHRASA